MTSQPTGQPAPVPTKQARPAWANEDLIVCQGGPWDGWWFTATDWHERQDAAAWMAARHQRPTAISTYTATDTRQDHPRILDASGTVWTTDQKDTEDAVDDLADEDGAW